MSKRKAAETPVATPQPKKQQDFRELIALVHTFNCKVWHGGTTIQEKWSDFQPILAYLRDTGNSESQWTVFINSLPPHMKLVVEGFQKICEASPEPKWEAELIGHLNNIEAICTERTWSDDIRTHAAQMALLGDCLTRANQLKLWNKIKSAFFQEKYYKKLTTVLAFYETVVEK